MDDALGKKLVDKYREHYSAGGLYECDLYPGIVAELTALRDAGKALAIVSSKPAPFIKRLLEQFGIDAMFEVISAPDIGHVNPSKAQLINAALERMDLLPCDAVMVGDRLFDIVGGKEAGTLTLGAAYGYGGEQEMEANGADLIALRPNQISELIFNYEKTY